MLIVSQNITNYDINLPSDAIFRINLAWINNLDTLKNILEKHSENNIFIDLPKNRTKPPNNKYSMNEIKPILENYSNIKYIAISFMCKGHLAFPCGLVKSQNHLYLVQIAISQGQMARPCGMAVWPFQRCTSILYCSCE